MKLLNIGEKSLVVKNINLTGILFAIIILFILPFLMGIVFVLLAAVGITPTWEVISLNWNAEALRDSIYIKQIVLAFMRANLIGIVVFMLVFISGYLLSINFNKKYIQTCMYFLAIPHISLALGFSFLLMPSGILFRLIARATHSTEVGHISLIHDSLGISMSVVVVIKLVAFIMFMLLAGLQDYKLQYQVLQSKLLRHNKFQTWLYIIFPQMMPKIFVPFLISIAYAISPIDVASILGHRFPPTIGIMIRTLFNQVQREEFINGNVLCIVLGIASILSLFLWTGVFYGVRKILRKGYVCPHKYYLSDKTILKISKTSFFFFTGIVVVSTILLCIWSIVIRWDFPDFLPTRIGITNQISYLTRFTSSINHTMLIAMLSTLISLFVSIVILEMLNALYWRRQFLVLGILLLPILLPSIVYITGVHMFFLYLGINGTLFAMVWVHALRVTPYITLLLYGVFKTYNPYFIIQAKVLGKRYLKTLYTIKLPMLILPIGYAVLIGMLVCVTEYVYAQFIGEGKWETVTLLTISLYSGGNRQIMSISGVLLTVLNLLILMLGLWLERMQKGIIKVKL